MLNETIHQDPNQLGRNYLLGALFVITRGTLNVIVQRRGRGIGIKTENFDSRCLGG